MNKREAISHIVGMARIYLGHAQAEKALRLLDAAAALGGPDNNIDALRCDALMKLGRQDEANVLSEKLQRHAPSNWRKCLAHLRVVLLTRLNKPRYAAEQLRLLLSYEQSGAEQHSELQG